MAACLMVISKHHLLWNSGSDRKDDEFYLDEIRQKAEMNVQDFVNFSEELGNENNGNRMRHPSR